MSTATSDIRSGTIPRRHDLDALRAIAMLLGILLHGMLAYIPAPDEAWPVHDSASSTAYGVATSYIHGFRLPLFFLVSGFFTAMLWRKRGLKQLFVQRSKRILLPLVIGTVTIVPVTWVALIGAGIRSAVINGDVPANVWHAARGNDLTTLQTLVDDGANPSALDQNYGMSPLSYAAAEGSSDVAEYLLAQGVDPNLRNRDGSTPLHMAAFFGRPDVAQPLIEAGASTSALNRLGESPVEMLGVGGLRMLVNAGMLKVDMADSDRSAVASLLAEASGAASGSLLVSDPKDKELAGLIYLLTMFPLFHHLWFLWFLCWLVVLFAVYAKLADRVNWQRWSAWIHSSLRYLWLIPLTALPLMTMGKLYPNFGPDTSTSILPMPSILAFYAVFFFFGAIYFDANDRDGRLGRYWRWTLPLASLVVFPLGYELCIGDLGFTKSEWLDQGWCRPLAILLQALFAWMIAFSFMGMFREFANRESRWMRYLSDSSYWLYLAHLPLVVVGQSIVQTWPIGSLAKLAIVCFASTVLLVISYQFGVRYTPVGRLLNGPRKRPERPTPMPVAEIAGN